MVRPAQPCNSQRPRVIFVVCIDFACTAYGARTANELPGPNRPRDRSTGCVLCCVRRPVPFLAFHQLLPSTFTRQTLPVVFAVVVNANASVCDRIRTAARLALIQVPVRHRLVNVEVSQRERVPALDARLCLHAITCIAEHATSASSQRNGMSSEFAAALSAFCSGVRAACFGAGGSRYASKAGAAAGAAKALT